MWRRRIRLLSMAGQQFTIKKLLGIAATIGALKKE